MGPTGGSNALKTERAIQRVGWISLLAACLTAGLMVYGGWVRASGSGLGCPDWPLCKGVLVPALHKSTAIEFGHRLFAGVTIITVAIAVAAAFRVRRPSPGTYRLLLAALLVMVVQAGIGGITVLTDLHGAAVVAHLTMAMASLALLTFGALAALRPKAGADPGVGPATALLAMGAVLMLLGGALVATGSSAACPGVPLCDGRTDLWPSILHALHRVAAVALVLTLTARALSLHRQKGSRLAMALNHGVSLVVVVEVLVGLLNVWDGFPQGLRVLHLGLATLVWWGVASSWSLAVLARRA